MQTKPTINLKLKDYSTELLDLTDSTEIQIYTNT